jgi:RNA polymerase-binding transcription factor DksA|tara:strand:+ start:1344 stop:2264 length:921 start_codon:yes stop_codon:yes gene_type:complete
MSAKKKSAAKKTVKKAAKKTPAKKAASNKAVVKKAAKKAAPKKAAKKAAAKKAATPKASELLKRTQHETPAIFKVGTRKAASVVYTLEDVRAFLAKKAKETPKPKKKAAKKAAKKVATAPAAVTEEIPEPVASKRSTASLADILGFGAGPAKSEKAAPKNRAVPRKHKRNFDALRELRAHVRASLGMHAEDTLGRSMKEDSGDISTSSDSASDTFNRDFALSVVSSEQEALKELDAAIERIYAGSYGVCEITKEAISEERLSAVPFTRFSLTGQKEHELTARRRITQVGAYLSEGSGEGVTFGDDG